MSKEQDYKDALALSYKALEDAEFKARIDGEFPTYYPPPQYPMIYVHPGYITRKIPSPPSESEFLCNYVGAMDLLRLYNISYQLYHRKIRIINKKSPWNLQMDRRAHPKDFHLFPREDGCYPATKRPQPKVKTSYPLDLIHLAQAFKERNEDVEHILPDYLLERGCMLAAEACLRRRSDSVGPVLIPIHMQYWRHVVEEVLLKIRWEPTPLGHNSSKEAVAIINELRQAFGVKADYKSAMEYQGFQWVESVEQRILEILDDPTGPYTSDTGPSPFTLTLQHLRTRDAMQRDQIVMMHRGFARKPE